MPAWSRCLSGSSWRVTGRKWEHCYTKAKLQQIRTSILRSRPKFPFLLFSLSWSRRKHYHNNTLHHFLSEMLEGRHSNLQIHLTWCKSVLTWQAWPKLQPSQPVLLPGERDWASKPSPVLTAWMWQWLFPSSRFTPTSISVGIHSHGRSKEMN